jgi:hypothetical protein
MIESVLLIDAKGVSPDTLRSVSLMNAKQLVLGRIGDGGAVLHVAATAVADLQQAVLEFAKVPGVTGVLTLAVRTRE